MQIDYSEPWLLSLIGAHLFVFVLIVYCKRNLAVLGIILGVLGEINFYYNFVCSGHES